MAIQFKNVSYYYDKTKTHAIKDINLKINENNEFIALIGQIGSGKSTLVQLMNGLLTPSEGKIEVFGQKINSKTPEKCLSSLRSKIGLVFQFPEYQLFETTVLKDVIFALKNLKINNNTSEKKAIAVLKRLGIEEDLFISSPFKLSGGQQRKVALAGILVMDPAILVLDEPTRGLDVKSQIEIMNFFQELFQIEKKTIIFITHNIDLVSEYANRVILLEKGQIMFDGSKEDFFMNEKFNKFETYKPQTFQLAYFLEKELNIPFIPVYSFKEMLKYLKKFYEGNNGLDD
ncbi:MAG: ATP-binding cassette domain-containing protein [Candidatus Phytoplasma pruni]|uniref:ATP-binding cassette domain-containing protein n=1 Tax=Milkweed yellows phytoplasma TaxID=208434 RepID=UPI000367A9CD|nr:ATP-binding cassette domain-containing protein [Milkweed yellows phytoplasma]